MPAPKISLDEAKPDKLFYFVANATVYRPSDGRCLLLKRSDREKVHPGKWATPGGKLEWGDLQLNEADETSNDVICFNSPVEKLLRREIKEEAGIEVEEKFYYLNKSLLLIRPDGIPVVNPIFASVYKSGEVKVEAGGFTDFAWVNETEVGQYDCIADIAGEIRQTIKLFRSTAI